MYVVPGPDDDGNQLTESESEWWWVGEGEGVGVVRGLLSAVESLLYNLILVEASRTLPCNLIIPDSFKASSIDKKIVIDYSYVFKLLTNFS